MPPKTTRSDSITTLIDDNMLEAIVNKLGQKLTQKIEEQLENLTTKFEKMESKLNNVSNELNKISEKLTSLEGATQTNQKEVAIIKDKLDIMEQNTRRNTLRMIGVKEDGNEQLLSKVLNIINEALKVKCSHWEIDNVYRVGKYNENQMKPRHIIITFVTYLKRNEIYTARRGLKGSGIFINEDLVETSYKLLLAAKKTFGPRDVWSRNGRIYLRRDNTVLLINNETDLVQVK